MVAFRADRRAGDDLAHKETDSAAVNAVRAMMRGEPERAREIINKSECEIHP